MCLDCTLTVPTVTVPTLSARHTVPMCPHVHEPTIGPRTRRAAHRRSVHQCARQAITSEPLWRVSSGGQSYDPREEPVVLLRWRLPRLTHRQFDPCPQYTRATHTHACLENTHERAACACACRAYARAVHLHAHAHAQSSHAGH